MDIEKLKNWFTHHQRDFPWRVDHTPYRVWVSEVMLQQTQASVVIPYFLRWMERFPTIRHLAKATQEEVVKEWEGLGYYSRARNLHAGAKMLVENFGGNLPFEEDKLKTIKGLGPYTIGAIRSFAFRQKAAAVDGNVIRVISRLSGVEEDMAKAKNQKIINEKVYNLLPEKEPWVISEALIELGATVCKKVPICHECPLKGECHAFLHNKTEKLPFKSTKTKYTTIHRSVAVIICGSSILLRKGRKGKVMEGLYEFPYFETSEDEKNHDQQVIHRVRKDLSLDIEISNTLAKETHSYTRFRVHLYPILCTSNSQLIIKNHGWYTFEDVALLPFSSGHKRVLLAVQQHLANVHLID